jgi:hypothetical protein
VYERGDILTDREQDSEVVVVQLSSDRADEYVIKERDPSENRYSDQTVYDFNARYGYAEPTDPVVQAVYSESLPANPHGLTKDGRAILVRNVVARDADVQTYAFPISRLVPPDDS